MNLATIISCDSVGRPPTSGRLGAPEDADLQAWETYLRSIRDQMVSSWNDARDAYLTLKKVRESFGLPFIARGEGAMDQAREGALTEIEDKRFIDTGGAVKFLAQVADDALAGRRKVAYAPDTGMVIELLPDDAIRVDRVNGDPRIVDAKTGQPVNVEGDMESGALGALPAIAWGLGIAVVAAVAVYFTADAVCNTIKDTAQQRTTRTVAKQQYELVKSGKATPEEAKKMTDAIYLGSAAVERSKGAAKKEEGETGIQSTARTLAYAGVAIAGIIALALIVPTLVARGGASAAAA